MANHDFYERRYIEYYIPELVRQVTELNSRLDKLNALYTKVLERDLESLSDINKRIQEGMDRIKLKVEGN